MFRSLKVLLAAFLSILIGNSVDAQLDRLRKPNQNRDVVRALDERMALIPAGQFWMGVDGLQGLDDERPRHWVRLDAYSIDVYEVTVRHYAVFLSATSRAQPAFWETVKGEEDANRPVIGVDWHDAEAYCRWAGKRLPT